MIPITDEQPVGSSIAIFKFRRVLLIMLAVYRSPKNVQFTFTFYQAYLVRNPNIGQSYG